MTPIDYLKAGAWAWEKIFGTDIYKVAKGALKKEWENFRWGDATKNYHEHLTAQYSTLRVLGKSEPVPLEGIFTDAYILDRPTALRRFDIEALRKDYDESKRRLAGNEKRHNAVDLAKEKDRLYILGKPGAGKTTFLKYLVLQALENKIEKIPIFISLHAWSQQKTLLMAYIVKEFDVCGFPDAESFIEKVLQDGWAMILFDGLDEVNIEDEQRSTIITEIRDFIRKHSKNKFMITCRIAASDYSFEGFTDVEMADFDNSQVKIFAIKWFSHNEMKGKKFLEEIAKQEHQGLRELAKTPLLLALLCIGFEETMSFSARRDEVYREAFEALLKKWDTSRNIKRDETYRGLSLRLKERLFARVAAEYFQQGEIFFEQEDLAREVEKFLGTLPSTDKAEDVDGNVVIKAIEAQHGIFVERALGIYSFSHLAFQEYFTARYVVENAARGAFKGLLGRKTDRRWREVFLLTASMLDQESADEFFLEFRKGIDLLIADDEKQIAFCIWAVGKAKDYEREIKHPAIARVAAHTAAEFARIRNLGRDLSHNSDFDLIIPLTISLAFDLSRGLSTANAKISIGHSIRFLSSGFNLAYVVDPTLDFYTTLDIDLDHTLEEILKQLLKRAKLQGEDDLCKALMSLLLPDGKSKEAELKAFAEKLRVVMIQHCNIGHDWGFTEEQEMQLSAYEDSTVLLAECLKLAQVSNRKKIEDSLLMPPGEWEGW